MIREVSHIQDSKNWRYFYWWSPLISYYLLAIEQIDMENQYITFHQGVWGYVSYLQSSPLVFPACFIGKNGQLKVRGDLRSLGSNETGTPDGCKNPNTLCKTESHCRVWIYTLHQSFTPDRPDPATSDRARCAVAPLPNEQLITCERCCASSGDTHRGFIPWEGCVVKFSISGGNRQKLWLNQPKLGVSNQTQGLKDEQSWLDQQKWWFNLHFTLVQPTTSNLGASKKWRTPPNKQTF